ncbi:MAG: DUF2271 domain-containing protein, partial [Proteobacteria bacterium]|nr:DUF2271 domain-containing protein [Pseudomonadota bacterium]
MITEKIGKMRWKKAPSDPLPVDKIRRLESLPVWAWKQGEMAPDGIPLPTKENPMPDTITHPSPKKDFMVKSSIAESHNEIYLYFEVNHSTDFNEMYNADLPQNDLNFNGGIWGSGQPALVYRAYLNFSDQNKSDSLFELVGHSSPSGDNGRIYKDCNGIDSAMNIINSVSLN